MLWCASGPGLDLIQLLLLKLLHDYTFWGPKILKIKPKKPDIPHQVESSVDSIVRRHKSANRKSFLNSASEDENDTANEEPKLTRSAKRARWENTEGKPHQHYEPLQLNQYQYCLWQHPLERTIGTVTVTLNKLVRAWIHCQLCFWQMPLFMNCPSNFLW
jgi:hypothetical protein